MNPRVNLKLLVMVGQKFVMVGQKFVMVGQETVMVGQMPAHAHPWLRHCGVGKYQFDSRAPVKTCKKYRDN